jgi:hypothetical protein
MGVAEQPKLVENPYRAAMVAARSEVLRVEAAVRAALRLPHRTLALAWRCPAADELAAGLAGAERTALAAIEESLAELDATIRAQLELVPASAWQARWAGSFDPAGGPSRGSA